MVFEINQLALSKVQVFRLITTKCDFKNYSCVTLRIFFLAAKVVNDITLDRNSTATLLAFFSSLLHHSQITSRRKKPISITNPPVTPLVAIVAFQSSFQHARSLRHDTIHHYRCHITCKRLSFSLNANVHGL